MLTVFHNGTLVNNETASNDISVYSSCLMSSLGIILIRSAASKVSFSDYLFCILWTTDFTVYKHAIRLERISKKIEKCKLDINFLLPCCDANIIPNFTNLSKVKQMNKRSHFKFCWKLQKKNFANNSSSHKIFSKTFPLGWNRNV